jgi:flagellin-specific chaperone FliS
MRSLYDYFDRRLQESNMAKTEPGILEVIKHVTVLRDAWAEMLQRGAVAVDTTYRARLHDPGSAEARPSA